MVSGRLGNDFKPAQLLIEVLIGIGLTAVMIAAIIPLMFAGANASASSSKNTQAILLAKEQIEAAEAIKEENWNNIYFPLGTSDKGAAFLYHPVISGSSWQLASGEETLNVNGIDYKRSLIIENVSRTGFNAAGEIELIYNSTRDDPSTQKIISMVSGYGSQVAITAYFTRWKNLIWTQSDWAGGSGSALWQDPPANRYFSGADVDVTTSPGAVQLAKIGGAVMGNYGNRFLVESTAGIGQMKNSTIKTDLRFKAQTSSNVAAVRVNIQAVKSTGGAPVYRFGLQADDPNNPGLPSGIYLASGTSSFSTTGWQNINFSTPPASITSGSTYHLVVGYDSGPSPSNNRYISILNSMPLNNLVPKTMSLDDQQNVLWYNGTSWSVQNKQPIYLLSFQDGTFEGNPNLGFATGSIYGNIYEGEKFTPSQDKTISAISLYVSCQNPSAPLMVTLADLTDGINVINDTFFDCTGQTFSLAWRTFNLLSNVTLTGGHQYQVYFNSATSRRNYYGIYKTTNSNAVEYNNSNWDGTDSVASRSTNAGGSWTNTNYQDLVYNFNTVETAYAPFGELISSTFDVQNRAGFNRISWETLDAPAGTVIKFQLATNNDNATWDFKGPSGMATDYYTFATGENILTVLYNNRYLRYKLRLETSNNALTPVLGAIKINYSP